jgi:hypothetical protein
MPPSNRRPNAGKPWTPKETETLRRLAEARAAPRLIADRLGWSLASVTQRAETLGLSIGEGSLTRRLEQKEAQHRASFGQDPPQD